MWPRSPVLPPASIAPRWQLLGPAPTITGEQAVPIAALSLYFTNMPWGAFFHQPTQQIPFPAHFMQAKMTCRMFRPFSGVSSLTCFGLSSFSWQQKCIGPSGSSSEPPRKQGRPASKTTTRWRRLRPAGSPQAAFSGRASRRRPKLCQPRSISRVVCADRPHRPCYLDPAAVLSGVIAVSGEKS
eukprot:scaffold5452_cov69-Phaeocystis_antarctica.AAC.1